MHALMFSCTSRKDAENDVHTSSCAAPQRSVVAAPNFPHHNSTTWPTSQNKQRFQILSMRDSKPTPKHSAEEVGCSNVAAHGVVRKRDWRDTVQDLHRSGGPSKFGLRGKRRFVRAVVAAPHLSAAGTARIFTTSDGEHVSERSVQRLCRAFDLFPYHEREGLRLTKRHRAGV